MKLFGASIGFGFLLVVLFFSGIVGAVCWPYAINTWLIFLGKAPVIVWWHGFILGYVPFIGQAAFPVAVVTWILMLFLL